MSTNQTVCATHAGAGEDSYGRVQKYYNRFYSRTDIHYAYWDESTRTQADAVQNTNRTICRLLGVRENDTVLDAGVGLGGTSIHVARECRARVEGVDNSQSHIDQARANAAAAGVTPLVNYSLQDHRRTSFPAGHFDHVIAIESVSAADVAEPFLREAQRVLKPGGRMAIVAMALVKASGGKPLLKQRHASHLAFEVNRSKQEFCSMIEAAGFESVVAHDLMQRIRLATRTWYLLPILALIALSKLRVVDAAIGENLHTLIESERAMARGELCMAIFVAQKR